MGRSSVLAVIFTLLIVSATSNATLFNSRKLVDLAPTQSNNSSSEQISDSNTPVEGEKEVNASKISHNKPEIGKEKPENPEGSNDPPKPPLEELNSTKVNDGSSVTEKQKPKDPQVRNDSPKDSVDQNSTTVNDGSPIAESKQPNDAQGSTDPSKLNPKEPNSTVVDGGSSKGEKEKPKDPQPQGSTDSHKLDKDHPKSDNSTAAESPPPAEKKETEEKKNLDDKINSEVNTNESCQGATKMCRVEQTLIACIQNPQNGSAGLFLVVQNEGEKRVKVNISIQPHLDSSPQAIKLSKHQSEKIDISSIMGKGSEIVLNAGDGSCRLQLDRRVSMDNILQQVSLYCKRVTPVYGAYFLFLVTLLFGGTWACCKLRKKRHQDGVPYQELEMGVAESASATNVVTADGWDEDWDDDWDEENAVKSPGGHTYGNISANGLTSRSSKKDGWENDWDD
ncbi:PREDICTED: uncharacterized protein LOC109243268 [Nicotiana attenuata]|uniref:DUF7356 domain-containing protein n=1 Tax=Nicotiana attenuata TaxID=49451 RepID=A0A314L3J4_NICAT|nr:PREDICTED: uncharacterized protein LOC109243268 [Nicotiana attenuata]OIT35524.1 hypothetical protein A4A49_23589 [Nicotiana attenuata]